VGADPRLWVKFAVRSPSNHTSNGWTTAEKRTEAGIVVRRTSFNRIVRGRMNLRQIDLGKGLLSGSTPCRFKMAPLRPHARHNLVGVVGGMSNSVIPNYPHVFQQLIPRFLSFAGPTDLFLPRRRRYFSWASLCNTHTHRGALLGVGTSNDLASFRCWRLTPALFDARTFSREELPKEDLADSDCCAPYSP
jgi:hypothetical protein